MRNAKGAPWNLEASASRESLPFFFLHVLLFLLPEQAQESTAAPQQTQASYAPTVTDQQGLDIIHSQQRRDANDARAKGSIDAPVVMVLYSDFSCPYCTRFAKQVEPQLQDLVDNGTLRIEWRDLAQISQSSPLAAQAGIAAANQGRFWEFVSAAYGEADPSGHPEYTMDSLTALAQKAGVPDISRFQADTNDPETAAEVKKAQNDAYKIGIQGTPFMFIGDSFISGFRDADYVRATIQNQAEHLKK